MEPSARNRWQFGCSRPRRARAHATPSRQRLRRHRGGPRAAPAPRRRVAAYGATGARRGRARPDSLAWPRDGRSRLDPSLHRATPRVGLVNDEATSRAADATNSYAVGSRLAPCRDGRRVPRAPGRRQAKRCRLGFRCPAHEDRHQSLSVGEGTDGRILIHCFAGCSMEAIVAATGLETSDLFREGEGQGYTPPRSRQGRQVVYADWDIDQLADTMRAVLEGEK